LLIYGIKKLKLA